MARTTTAHTIVRQSSQKLGPTALEAVGSAALMPGWLVQIQAAGDKLGKHSPASGMSAKLVVLENKTPDTHTYPTTANIDIPYTSGDLVYFMQAQSGDVLNMWIASAAPAVKKGKDWMISDGAGHLTSCGTGINAGTSNPIGIAWEDKDNSGNGSAVRLLVRIV